MKKLFLLLTVLSVSLVLTGCKKEPSYAGLDTDVVGQIDVMLWSGSGERLEDIGHQNLTSADLFAQNDAAAYAVAKEFNKIYPNVVINVLAMSGGPTDGDRIWAQELENYRAAYNVFPSVWATIDLPGDIQKGLVADLSRFEDDPLYQSMNPSIMNMMNYYGFQGGLPQYILPWGIYVNKELAEDFNLDVPDPDWDIDDYSDFIDNSEESVYYGSMDTPLHIINTGTTSIMYSMFNHDGTGDYVNLDSDEVRSLIPYLQDWNDNSLWGGNPSTEFMDAGWWWSYKFFIENKLLTLEGDPWMMGDCATSDPDWAMRCKSADWDIYPRPSTDYVDNTVGIVLDPMAVYNYCLDDGDIACTEEEEAKIKLAYTFAAFWIADTDSWQARADMSFSDATNSAISSALNDSFPVTTGDTFAEQMQIWYQPDKHQRFSDASLMPGFHEVVRIYEEGQFWDVSDKAYPYFHSVEGSRRVNLYEWDNYWNDEINGGVVKADANFVDTILGNLTNWNELANARFTEAFEDLQRGLKTYYGYTDENF
jgi:ABC-type glycerol-3-phosphate transport system substrate-binding protein